MGASRTIFAVVATLSLGAGAAHASYTAIEFLPAAYQIIDADVVGCPNASAPCEASPDTILSVSIVGPMADFGISDQDNPSWNFSFSLPDYLAPTGFEPGGSPYYEGPHLAAPWDTTIFPYVTFWSAVDGGAITIGSTPNESGPDLVDFFASAADPEPDFALVSVPEPDAWVLILLGAGLCGAGLRRRRAAVLAYP
jgi:hypothetical protein